MDVSTVTRDAAIGATAAVVVPAAIYAGPRLFKRMRAKREAKAALEAKRDATREQVARMLGEVGGDLRCLYQIQMPHLEALEVTLVALHGEKLNGNVDEALKKVRRAKDTINNRLNDKVCDDIGEGVD